MPSVGCGAPLWEWAAVVAVAARTIRAEKTFFTNPPGGEGHGPGIPGRAPNTYGKRPVQSIEPAGFPNSGHSGVMRRREFRSSASAEHQADRDRDEPRGSAARRHVHVA